MARTIVRCIVSLAVLALTGVLVIKVGAQPPAEEKLPAILTAMPRTADPGDDELKKLLIARFNAAQKETQAGMALFRSGRLGVEHAAEAARHVQISDLDLSNTLAEKIAVHEKSLEFAKYVESITEERFNLGVVDVLSMQRAHYLRFDAEVQLLRAKRPAH